MSQRCPACQQSLAATDEGFHCASCAVDYARQACCPDCQQPLQVLKACGAIDYFCQHGHGLVSKKRLLFTPVG